MDPVQRDVYVEETLDMQKKRDVAQMSAAAIGICLDIETQKKFLRVSTSQELETENAELAKQLEQKTEGCGYWYTEAHTLRSALWELQETQRQLKTQRRAGTIGGNYTTRL